MQSGDQKEDRVLNLDPNFEIKLDPNIGIYDDFTAFFTEMPHNGTLPDIKPDFWETFDVRLPFFTYFEIPIIIGHHDTNFNCVSFV